MMRLFALLACLSIYSDAIFAAVLEPSAPRTLMTADFMRWGGGLILVLGIFFLCVWAVHKAGGLTSPTAGQMRVLAGLSLGAKERVVLLQLGNKQLLLGVSPGRVEALHTLEGEDCLIFEDAHLKGVGESQFAQKLRQVIKKGQISD
ncbi:MAG: flagellar biosynthetic protein FliO [Methyloprofundus sp.]|nr:flagellar biosynthetic protein FliO [Methyloprofundus sp.]MBW6453585.1 flagellar biosynthetic protein FliO [Methyloprofundus sp.]